MDEQDQKADPYTFQDGDLTLRKVPPLGAPPDLAEQRARVGKQSEGCRASVLCRHAYIAELDDPKLDRESRDLQRIACLNSADVLVTESPDSVRFMHRSGGWIEHDGESITQLEVMLYRAYETIETQIWHGDASVLGGLAEVGPPHLADLPC